MAIPLGSTFLTRGTLVGMIGGSFSSQDFVVIRIYIFQGALYCMT